MTIAGQSAGHQYAVGAFLESVQDMDHIHPTAACDFNDLDRGWVLNPQAAGEIGGVVSAVTAAKGDDLGFELLHHQS
jgi:hypothetical protein